MYSFNTEIIEFVKNFYVGFCVLELSKLVLYEWYYDKRQPYFREDNLELHYMDTDSFIFPFKPTKGSVEDLKQFRDFDFTDLDPSHELYSKDNKKVFRKMKLETAPELDLDEAVFLRIKSYCWHKTECWLRREFASRTWIYIKTRQRSWQFALQTQRSARTLWIHFRRL